MTVEVRKVETANDFRAFFEFPWTLYKDDPNWVPMLLSMRRELLDKDKHPAWDYLEGDYFTAWRGDRIVGTIAAVINHRHNEFADENIGWFGTFEVYDDTEAAQALLTTASDWVRNHGGQAIRGPQSFTTHEECGLLVEGFDLPMILMPYNPPYYEKLVEEAGFERVMDVVSLYYDRPLLAETGLPERLQKLAERVHKRSRITIRNIDMKRKKQEFALFKELYNAAWAQNWGFVPMTERELDALVDSLGMFLEKDLAFFAEIDGQPAGFALGIPNLNEALHKAYPRPGVPELWTLLNVAWHWKVKRSIRGIRLPLMGVLAEYRNRGVDLALLNAVTQALLPLERVTHLDAGWILETNQLVSIAVSLGAKPYRRHRFYEKALT